MNYLDELYDEKQRFITLKRKVKDVANGIDDVIRKFDAPIENAKKNLVIDGDTPVATKLEGIKSELVRKKSSLTGPIMRAINSKISYYEDEILAEEERLRELEEEKLKQQEVLPKNKKSYLLHQNSFISD